MIQEQRYFRQKVRNCQSFESILIQTYSVNEFFCLVVDLHDPNRSTAVLSVGHGQ